MSLRTETHQVANGRRRATRAIVLQSLQSIPCFVFRKVIVKVPDSYFDDRTDETWGGLGVASTMDEHAFDYEPLGYAMMTVEQFLGGAIHDNGMLIVPDEATMSGQVEPVVKEFLQVDSRNRRQYFDTIPDWTPQKEDLFCLMIAPDDYIFMECVGKTGSSLMSDFGAKYVFNQKFNLDFIPNLDEGKIEDMPALK